MGKITGAFFLDREYDALGMLFHSSQFFFLLIGTLLVYALARTPRSRSAVLLGASLIYIFYSGLRDGAIIIGLTLFNLFVVKFHQRRERFDPTKPDRWLLATAVFFNILPLLYFKYTNFVVAQLSGIADILIAFLPGGEQPFGLSFVTFVLIAYQVDVYNKKLPAESDWLFFGLFSSFFPSFSAGPIMRGSRLIPQLKSLGRISYPNLRAGFFHILLGLTKKIVLADHVSPMVDLYFSAAKSAPLTFLDAWTAAIGFGLQIYCDFSGYSDIAVGLARCFGVDLAINFRQPYLSANPSDFWRRWHISLSEWLRDYVYIPLGGNRSGGKRTVLNLLATMLICGFWHGANWTFLFWGLLHGLYLIGYRLLKSQADSFPRFVALVTFLLAMIAWVFFRAEDLAHAMGIVRSMLCPLELGTIWAGINCLSLISLSLGIQWFERKAFSGQSFIVRRWQELSAFWKGMLLATHLTVLVISLKKELVFIYFRF